MAFCPKTPTFQTTHATDEYERIAACYDTILEPFLGRIRREVCRIVQAEGCGNIIDICCGTGRQAIMLAASGLHTTAVDISPAMLAQAHAKSPTSITYYQEDASDLHFEDRAFQCAVISFALHEKEDKIRERIVQEALRILTEDGKIVLVDYLRPRNVRSRFGHILVDMVERMAGKKHHEHFRSYMTKGALEGLMARHGLVPLLSRNYLLGAIGIVLAAIVTGSAPSVEDN